jgi:hypothetical protein
VRRPVLNAKAVRQIGVPRLNAVNEGKELPGFFLGGLFKSPLFGLGGMAGLMPFGLAGLLLKGEKGPKIEGGSSPALSMEGQSSGGGSNIFNIHINGSMNDRDARRTGYQIASAAQLRMAQARKSGMAG